MDKISPDIIEVQNTSCWEDSSPRSEGLKIESITSCATKNAPQSYTVHTSGGRGAFGAQPLATQQCDDMGELEWGDQRDEMNCSSEAGSTPPQSGENDVSCESIPDLQPTDCAASVTASTKVDVKDSRIQIVLEGADLWRRFNAVGTEMIITKAGR